MKCSFCLGKKTREKKFKTTTTNVHRTHRGITGIVKYITKLFKERNENKARRKNIK